MADQSHDNSHAHPENPIKYYIGVFTLLMVMTGLTVYVAQYDLEKHWGPLNALVALTIAVVKATAVIMIFMHVRWSSRLTQVIAVASVFWLLIMLSFTLSDYFTRGGWPTGLGEY
jgi:cytochrome c oxidase subunit 4